MTSSENEKHDRFLRLYVEHEGALRGFVRSLVPTACLHLAPGFDYEGSAVNPPGYEAVFKRDKDGAGYTVEARVPWSLHGVQDDPPRAGDALAVCWHAHWSDASGRLWRTSLVELRNPSEPLRIYDYERATTWDRAIYR